MAENAFNDFWRSYQESSRALNHLSTRTKTQIERMERILIAAYQINKKRNKILENAFIQGGAVYDYMRRLMHFGNYMQAPIVVGKVMQKDHTPLIDLAPTVPTINDVRKKLATISDRIQKDDVTYKIVQEIIEGR